MPKIPSKTPAQPSLVFSAVAIVAEIRKRMRFADFSMKEYEIANGGKEPTEDNDTLFKGWLWEKCRLETLESLLWFIEGKDVG